ncbi:MAG TPA: zinc-ribbon domain-containing protein [Pyrinomonadaceae bacterium]|jgi:hypothetical protein|nr:zinc-ribbon domain-containing protein [Pyrinomonadaceae bacterium]
MFCPKCGTENPETGRFCRSCGSDLGNVAVALSGALPQPQNLVDHKGRPVSLDRAIIKIFTGIAFLAVTIALVMSGSGRGWWFWMLIPAFTTLGAGIAQLIQLKNAQRSTAGLASPQQRNIGAAVQNPGLPPSRTDYVSPAESRYKTGDLVPPSVTDSTTRHLETNSEGETMTLPKI